jgi:hypothetical protein
VAAIGRQAAVGVGAAGIVGPLVAGRVWAVGGLWEPGRRRSWQER